MANINPFRVKGIFGTSASAFTNEVDNFVRTKDEVSISYSYSFSSSLSYLHQHAHSSTQVKCVNFSS